MLSDILPRRRRRVSITIPPPASGVFGDVRMTAALLDRLVHHCGIGGTGDASRGSNNRA